MIVLIPTELLPCALVSNCYLVTIFFIPIMREKLEFTSHAHSWSFSNIIVLCRLGSIHVVFLSYYYWERTELKWKIKWFVLSPTGIGVNFNLFTFVHVREQIRHSGTGALLYTMSFVHVRFHQKKVWNKTNGAGMCQWLLLSRYSC